MKCSVACRVTSPWMNTFVSNDGVGEIKSRVSACVGSTIGIGETPFCSSKSIASVSYQAENATDPSSSNPPEIPGMLMMAWVSGTWAIFCVCVWATTVVASGSVPFHAHGSNVLVAVATRFTFGAYGMLPVQEYVCPATVTVKRACADTSKPSSIVIAPCPGVPFGVSVIGSGQVESRLPARSTSVRSWSATTSRIWIGELDGTQPVSKSKSAAPFSALVTAMGARSHCVSCGEHRVARTGLAAAARGQNAASANAPIPESQPSRTSIRYRGTRRGATALNKPAEAPST